MKNYCRFSKKTTFLLAHFLLLGIFKSINLHGLSYWFRLTSQEYMLLVGLAHLFSSIARIVTALLVDIMGHRYVPYIVLWGSLICILGSTACWIGYTVSEKGRNNSIEAHIFACTNQSNDVKEDVCSGGAYHIINTSKSEVFKLVLLEN